MRSIYWIGLLLLLGSTACQKRTQHLSGPEDDVLARVCETEEIRHEDNGGGIVLFGNRAMDEYRRAPGAPEHLVAALKDSRGICRGALIQLLTVHHFDYLDKRWRKLTLSWDDQDYIFFANALSQQSGPLFERYTLVLLSPERPARVRKIAVNRLSQFDQAPYETSLGRLVRAYRDDSQLSHLLLHLDLAALPASAVWFEELFDHPNEDVHRDLILAWSTSELPNKKALIARYHDHPRPGVRSFARSVTDQLAGRDKLTMETQVSHVQVDSDADQATLNATFIEALYRLDRPAMETALDQGADINSRDRTGRPGLIVLLDRYSYRAVPAQYTPIVRRLSMPYREQKEKAVTALQFLLGLGAEVNVRLDSGETPLYMAAMYGLLEPAGLLLNHGADPALGNDVGFTPLDIARTMENQKMVDLLR